MESSWIPSVTNHHGNSSSRNSFQNPSDVTVDIMARLDFYFCDACFKTRKKAWRCFKTGKDRSAIDGRCANLFPEPEDKYSKGGTRWCLSSSQPHCLNGSLWTFRRLWGCSTECLPRKDFNKVYFHFYF